MVEGEEENLQYFKKDLKKAGGTVVSGREWQIAMDGDDLLRGGIV